MSDSVQTDPFAPQSTLRTQNAQGTGNVPNPVDDGALSAEASLAIAIVGVLLFLLLVRHILRG